MEYPTFSLMAATLGTLEHFQQDILRYCFTAFPSDTISMLSSFVVLYLEIDLPRDVSSVLKCLEAGDSLAQNPLQKCV